MQNYITVYPAQSIRRLFVTDPAKQDESVHHHSEHSLPVNSKTHESNSLNTKWKLNLYYGFRFALKNIRIKWDTNDQSPISGKKKLFNYLSQISLTNKISILAVAYLQIQSNFWRSSALTKTYWHTQPINARTQIR